MNISADQLFIFTEIYGCGKIGRIALKTLQKHCPNIKVNVFGVPNDFLWISELLDDPQFIFHDISSDKQILDSWNLQGHAGTAALWTKLILERKAKYYIHFDSDVIFTGDAFNRITSLIESGHDLVGTYRNYKYNLNNLDHVRHLDDVVQTAIFAFNVEKISDHSEEELFKMCLGGFNPLGHPVIDFFDPVMFEIIKNGGKVGFLNFDEFGGTNAFGKRDNVLKEFNTTVADIGTLFCHFASVGSGLKFATRPMSGLLTSKTYREFAIKKYTLFCSIFYDEHTRSLTENENKFLSYFTNSVVPMDRKNLYGLNKDMRPSFFDNFLELINILSIVIKKLLRKIKKVFL